MARVYLNKYGGGPLFTIEQGVGLNMHNERKDVKLIQFFLKAILHSEKVWLAGDTKMTPPQGGGALQVSGVWDEASRRYLSQWEELRSQAKAYWAHGHVEPTQFPGTVVPYQLGGKKIITMNEMCVVFFGKDSHATLNLPGLSLDPEVWKDLFYDPITGPQPFGGSCFYDFLEDEVDPSGSIRLPDLEMSVSSDLDVWNVIVPYGNNLLDHY